MTSVNCSFLVSDPRLSECPNGTAEGGEDWWSGFIGDVEYGICPDAFPLSIVCLNDGTWEPNITSCSEDTREYGKS